jgi:hypothetical protein
MPYSRTIDDYRFETHFPGIGWVCISADLTFRITPGEAPTRYYPNSELGNPGTPDSVRLMCIDARSVQCFPDSSDAIVELDLAIPSWWPLKRWIEAQLQASADPSDMSDIYEYYSNR